MTESLTLMDILDHMENLKHEELPKRLDSVTKLSQIANYLG